VRIDTTRPSWQPGAVAGASVMPLYERASERVRLVRLAPGTRLEPQEQSGGEEILVLEGAFEDERGRHPRGTWLRYPPGHTHGVFSEGGCTLYVKTGHLTAGAGS